MKYGHTKNAWQTVNKFIISRHCPLGAAAPAIKVQQQREILPEKKREREEKYNCINKMSPGGPERLQEHPRGGEWVTTKTGQRTQI